MRKIFKIYTAIALMIRGYLSTFKIRILNTFGYHAIMFGKNDKGAITYE